MIILKILVFQRGTLTNCLQAFSSTTATSNIPSLLMIVRTCFDAPMPSPALGTLWALWEQCQYFGLDDVASFWENSLPHQSSLPLDAPLNRLRPGRFRVAMDQGPSSLARWGER
jgi:hypothetical protein